MIYEITSKDGTNFLRELYTIIHNNKSGER